MPFAKGNTLARLKGPRNRSTIIEAVFREMPRNAPLESLKEIHAANMLEWRRSRDWILRMIRDGVDEEVIQEAFTQHWKIQDVTLETLVQLLPYCSPKLMAIAVKDLGNSMKYVVSMEELLREQSDESPAPRCVNADCR